MIASTRATVDKPTLVYSFLSMISGFLRLSSIYGVSIILYFRHDEPVKRPVRDNTPTLDEESSPEVIGVHRGTKNQGIFMLLLLFLSFKVNLYFIISIYAKAAKYLKGISVGELFFWMMCFLSLTMR